MQIDAQVTSDDIREFVYRAEGSRNHEKELRESIGELTRGGRKLVLSMAVFGVVVVWYVWQRGPEAVLSSYASFGMILLGLGLVPLAVIWLWSVGRLRRTLTATADAHEIDRTSLVDGVHVGATQFEWDEHGLRVSLAKVQSTFSWRAFQRLAETSNTFCLMIDDGSAIVVPKRASGEAAWQQAFQEFVAAKIEAAQ